VLRHPERLEGKLALFDGKAVAGASNSSWREIGVFSLLVSSGIVLT
jgi:hypothetical protein